MRKSTVLLPMPLHYMNIPNLQTEQYGFGLHQAGPTNKVRDYLGMKI